MLAMFRAMSFNFFITSVRGSSILEIVHLPTYPFHFLLTKVFQHHLLRAEDSFDGLAIFYFFYLKMHAPNKLMVSPRDVLVIWRKYIIFSRTPYNIKRWKEKFVFLYAQMFLGSVMHWKNTIAKNYKVLLPQLNGMEKHFVSHIVEHFSSLVLLEHVMEVFPIRGEYFIIFLNVNLYVISWPYFNLCAKYYIRTHMASLIYPFRILQ